jgi:hypothetical protein
MNETVFRFLVIFLVGFVLGSLITEIVVLRTWKQEAINKGLASYCSADGAWAWSGECQK